MKVVEILKISREALKMLSDNDSSVNDWQYIDLYEEFMLMKKRNVKVRAIADELSAKYSIGKSTVYKIIQRLSKDC